MPVSERHSKLVYDALVAAGVEVVSALPETWLVLLYKIPLLMLISDRGHLGEPDPWQTEGGRATRPILDALGIVTDELRDPAFVQLQVGRGMTLAQASLAPVALLLTRDLMWEVLG